MPGSIVIIDNERHVVKVLESALNREGYQTFSAEKGVAGLELVRQVLPVLVILDVMLPDIDGLSVCKHLRTYKQTRTIPIIIISAKSEEVDRVLGLEMGADDYIIKPFFPKEVVARVKVILRRYNDIIVKGKDYINETPQFIEMGEVKIDLQRHLVFVRGNEIEMTPKEYDLLKLFISHPGRAFTREYLLETIWGYEYKGDTTRTVDVHVLRLRQRIEIDSANPKYVETVRKIGYRFRETLE